MQTIDSIMDLFGRVREQVQSVLSGVSGEALAYRADSTANTVAWLLWHLTRVQDDHVADAFGIEQVWIADGWCERFGLPFDAHATGYGQSSAEVAQVRAEAALLRDYHDAVHDRTIERLHATAADDLDRIVDTRWDPPVTLAARLISVASDDLQHVGQAAFVRGLAERAATA